SIVHHVPFVFEVRDLWPESLVAVGAGKEKSPTYRLLAKVAAFLYQKADRVVVVAPAFREHLIEKRQAPREKISFVPNGVETKMFSPRPPNRPLLEALGAKNKFVVSFI